MCTQRSSCWRARSPQGTIVHETETVLVRRLEYQIGFRRMYLLLLIWSYGVMRVQVVTCRIEHSLTLTPLSNCKCLLTVFPGNSPHQDWNAVATDSKIMCPFGYGKDNITRICQRGGPGEDICGVWSCGEDKEMEVGVSIPWHFEKSPALNHGRYQIKASVND
jgi:hypothetical protein